MAAAATALAAFSAAAGKRLLLSSPSPSRSLSLSFASRRGSLPLRAGVLSAAPRRAASAAAAATVAVGDKLPDATLSYFDSPDGELKTVTVRDLTAGKKVVLFAVPGAFTPTCTQKHVPGYVARAGELRAKGVDTVACVSVNDAFVMRAWKESLGVRDEVLLLSDGNGELARAMGVELDLSDKPAGLGVRSRRYALLAEDGVVKVLNLEEGGAFTTSSAEDMLKAL
ncbi:peroxiredoxin-2E-1, chloroplastic [Oryza brachyantha]|uniref:peroxiredoxin-2E-1, chloroplastic n=1 Tax=Oryza brachyantha TaxID=4533 RepID=UPI001ADADA69|nr:peroxiredoxin-2E-1, chloroplastic [Oryza brachyantha]